MRDNSNYWTRRAASSRVSRRRVIGGAAAAGMGAAAFGLVGCGDDDDDATPTTAAGTTAAGSPTAASTAAASPTSAIVDGGIARSVFLGGSQFDSVDIHRGQRDEVGWLSGSVLSKIVRFSNPDAGDIEADLAEKWETPDATVYTFNLRKGVKWQNTPLTNGRELTSADIKWHIERQQAGKLVDGSTPKFRFQSDYAGIKVETPDNYTVKMTLPAPNGTFLLRQAAFFAGVPNREATEKFEGSHTTLTEEAMPGTSGYILKQWRTGKDIVLQKNPDYWEKGLPHLDGAINPWGLFEDPNAHRLAFEQKLVDNWGAPDASLTKKVLDDNKSNMYEVLTGISNTVLMHLNVHKQFKDPRLVKAMNMAVDRRAMIQSFHQGLGQVSGVVPWLQEGFAIKPDDLIKLPGYRTDRAVEIKEARELWNAGGGPALGEVDIKGVETWTSVWPDTYQIIAKMFNDSLGVSQFKSTKCTYNDDIIPNLPKGEYPSWIAWTNAVNSPDPRRDLYTSFHSKGSQNWSKVNNPQLDKLLDDALVTADLAKARALVLDAQKIIMENAGFGWVVLYNYIGRNATWNYAHRPLKTQPSAGKAGAGYWNTAGAHLAFKNSWLDPKDPSYSDAVKGRKLG